MSEVKRKIHVIPHTHWDREWYFTTTRSTIYLIKHVKEVLDVLENNDEFHYYLLDAQTSLIEDYLKYCPEDEDRIRKLVREGKLLTGPWYTQTDQLVVSQESVVRNLYYGTTTAEDLGHCMRVGYVPDVFGQGGNMPQIYRNFDIQDVIFWRGLADNRSEFTEIIWEGSDGSEVFAVQIPFGYCTFGFLPENLEDKEEFWKQQLETIEQRASTSHIYVSNGFDQAPIRKNLPEILKVYNEVDDDREFVITNPEKFFKEIKQDVKDLKTIKGELTQGKHSRVHKSIFSTRADMKQLNNEIENFLVNTLEPILSVSFSLGNRYPHREMEEIWKIMFENAAHDSIGGCNSDRTNRDIYYRYVLAKDKAETLLDIHMRLIAECIAFEEEINFTVFNPFTYQMNKTIEFDAYITEKEFELIDSQGNVLEYVIKEKKDLTDYVLNQILRINPSERIYVPDKVYLAKIVLAVKDLPALGYQTVAMKFSDHSQAPIEVQKLSEYCIENEFYVVELADNQTLTITEKKSGQVYSNQLIIEENGDDGDSYNYSPPRKDLVIQSVHSERVCAQADDYGLEKSLVYQLKMAVPKNLESRAVGKKDSEMEMKIQILLKKEDPLIYAKIEIDNQVESHRVCVLMDSHISSQVSTADQLFGIIQRPVSLPEVAIWEEEKWEEYPAAIEPMQSFVSLHDSKKGIAIFTQGVREYEIVGESFDTIRLTLFRTFGFMGKENLLYRPGRASGETIEETPDAQMLKKLTFEFGTYLWSGKSFDDASVAKLAKEYTTQIPVYQTADFLNGRLIYVYREEEKKNPSTYSLLDLGEMDAVVSTVKKAEHSSEFIVRFYNPYIENEAKVPVKLLDEKFVMLDETSEVNEISETLKPCEFKTVAFKIK